MSLNELLLFLLLLLLLILLLIIFNIDSLYIISRIFKQLYKLNFSRSFFQVKNDVLLNIQSINDQSLKVIIISSCHELECIPQVRFIKKPISIPKLNLH